MSEESEKALIQHREYAILIEPKDEKSNICEVWRTRHR
jgi:hypothetical protein